MCHMVRQGKITPEKRWSMFVRKEGGMDIDLTKIVCCIIYIYVFAD